MERTIRVISLVVCFIGGTLPLVVLLSSGPVDFFGAHSAMARAWLAWKHKAPKQRGVRNWTQFCPACGRTFQVKAARLGERIVACPICGEQLSYFSRCFVEIWGFLLFVAWAAGPFIALGAASLFHRASIAIMTYALFLTFAVTLALRSGKVTIIYMYSFGWVLAWFLTAVIAWASPSP